MKTLIKTKLLAIIIPLFLILSITNFLTFNFNFYEKEFYKYNIYEKYQKELIDSNVRKLLAYFKKDNKLDTGFFNEKEKLHLADVKNIISKGKVILFISEILFVLFFIYSFRKKCVREFLFWGGLYSIILIGILAISTLDFDSNFIRFHYLSFDNNLWLLNPETDNLINLFPSGFFVDIVKSIIIINIVVAFVFMLPFIFYKLKRN